MIKYICELKKSGPLQDWEHPYFIKRFYDEVFHLSDKCWFRNFETGKLALKHFNEYNYPLRLVSMTSKESFMLTAQYVQLFKEFSTFEVNKNYGFSFTEWLRLPPYLMRAFMAEVQEERRQINTIKQNHDNELEKLTNQTAEERYMEKMKKSTKAL